MQWLSDYWWIILVVLFGILLNAIKDLKRIDHKRFLENRTKLPAHRDCNDKWDDEDDWPKNIENPKKIKEEDKNNKSGN